ncbi:MAG: PQQ-binding-like beta-propeller repeat protein [Deltaproteobacteria bacterium]|nr:PQQ-binding-like beta-propeller repeat protein [Deltaproteobacteria bacterium]
MRALLSRRIFRFLLSGVGCILLQSVTTGCIQADSGNTSTNANASSENTTQYRGGPSHTGVIFSNAPIQNPYTLKWQTEPMAIGHYMASKSSPVADETQVYVGMDDGRLLAIRRSNGEIAWEFRTRSFNTEQSREGVIHYGIHGTPAVDDRRVYIGDYDGYMYAVDKESGALVWQQQLADSIGASPTLYNGRIYIAVEYASMDGCVFVMNAETGVPIWQSARLGAHPHSSVTIDMENRLFFVGANNGSLVAFDLDTMKKRWTYHTDGPVKSTAAVQNGIIYVTSWDTALHAVSGDTGELLFAIRTNDVTMSSPAVFQQTVYFGSHDSNVYAVDINTGVTTWTLSTNALVLSSVTVILPAGLLAVGSRDQHLYLLRTDGSLFQSIQVSGGISSVPAAADNELFVSDNDGIVYAFESIDPSR